MSGHWALNTYFEGVSLGSIIQQGSRQNLGRLAQSMLPDSNQRCVGIDLPYLGHVELQGGHQLRLRGKVGDG